MREGEHNRPQRYCGHCGASLRVASSFCVSCGKRVTLGVDNSEQSTLSSGLGGTRSGVSVQRSLTTKTNALPPALKIGLVTIVTLGLLTLVSPITFLVGVMATGVSVVILVVQATRHRPWKRWGVIAAVAIVPTLVFGSVSDILYDTSFLRSSSAPAPFGDVTVASYTIYNEEETLSRGAELKLISVESQASSDEELRAMAADINSRSNNSEFDVVGIRDVYEGEIYSLIIVFNTAAGAEALDYPSSYAEGSRDGDNIRIVDPTEHDNYY